MFLKRIELQGFKSFADKTILGFEKGVTGIVGPNGCGKSNITDAIRWVLGEQSAKSLRSGTSMSDIIFAGSQTRKPVNLAKVTLVFDNSAGIFPANFEEIEISRQIYRSKEAEYAINRTPCRLKDIQDLVMDTGLGRDSLSIISQGNISSFADAKPEDRRTIFEEAAGVAKYKKRKKVSLQKLDNTTANLERLQDIIDELERQLGPLEKQAAKALRQRALKKELADIETTVLVEEIDQAKTESDKLEQNLVTCKANLASNQTRMEETEDRLQEIRSENRKLDIELNTLQTSYTNLLQESVQLEKRKTELDEQQKRALEAAKGKEKARQLSILYAQAKAEYEDRKARHDQIAKDREQAQAQRESIRNALSQSSRETRDLSDRLNQVQHRMAGLETLLKTPWSHQQGVKAVMQARRSLYGIEGTVAELLVPDPGMAQAINAALGGAVNNIVTKDEQAARQAIRFLKQNRAGRATFLPKTACTARYPNKQQDTIVQGTPGIIGWASTLVTCEPAQNPVKDRLLANILVAETLEAANEVSNLLKKTVKVVTVDGDIVHAGGMMTGGFQKAASSPVTVKEEYAKLESQAKELRAKLDRAISHEQSLRRQLDSLENSHTAMQVEEGKLENLAAIKKEKMDSYKAQLDLLEAPEEAAPVDTVIGQLMELHKQIDDTAARLSVLRKTRLDAGERQEELEESLRLLRRETNALQTDMHNSELRLTKVQSIMENALNRLNGDYAMTYEFASANRISLDMEEAKERVNQLRAQLSRLGSVNEEAPEEFAALKERHADLDRQKTDLERAKEDILSAIAEMDGTMTTQFSEMFTKINGELQTVFSAMFGGGKASLRLSDPDNILESGVDIDVQPPGKTVKNIQTFSGGEKALIAISVLFAILKARTMPLCIFDEVEAALDQANVERFAKYISRFKEESQFIVVTHRPGTMEQCEDLYGITMQKDGVSTVLKVRLEEAWNYANQKEAA